MRWEDERYVRFYTRDTPEWMALSWHARGLFGLILRSVDRAGVLRVGKLGEKGAAVAVHGPWSEVESPLRELLADGCIVFDATMAAFLVPNFLEAQECAQSDKARKRASRERARAEFSDPPVVTNEAPARDSESRTVTTGGHETGQKVTSGHDGSRAVTPCRAVPCRTVPEKQQTLVPEAAPVEDTRGFDGLLATWNRLCAPAGFAKARNSEGHRKAARVRLREPGWRDAFEGACAYMAGNDFYRGGKDGTGWVADFGWLLKPGNAEKTADRAATKRPTGSTNGRPEDAELRRALAAAERGDDSGPGAEDPEPDACDGRNGQGIRRSAPLGPPSDHVASCAAPLSATVGALLGRGR